MSPTPAKRLHVALLSYRGNMFCGGQGVYVTALARALAERGHRVRLLAGPPYPTAVEGVELFKLPDHNYINHGPSDLPRPDPLAVLRPLEFTEYVLARAGSNPEMLAFSLRAFEAIRRLHRQDPLDVVHDNQGLGYGLLLVRALGIPVAATIHHPLQVDRAEDIRQLPDLTAQLKRTLYYPILMQKLVARRLDRVLSVSAFSADLIARAYGLDRSRLEVTMNGVDSRRFRRLPGVEREPGRLLFVGSTEDRKKGILYLLQALADLPERFRLIIVDGRRYPGRVYARDLVERLGLTGRVTFRDRIDDEELVQEYNRAEMMVMPSLFEGFGLPALEAMATGTPLICTRAGALPEVADEQSAVLVEPRDGGAIREAVLRLDGDAAARERLARGGRERAASIFTWDRTARQVESIYRAAAARETGA